jgi:hypothetical protein
MALKVKENPQSKSKTKAELKAVAPPQTVSPARPEGGPQSALARESSQTGVEVGQLIDAFTPGNLIYGVVMAEILGKPRSRSWGRRSYTAKF